jgi:3-isopropylmalate dehydrogenase
MIRFPGPEVITEGLRVLEKIDQLTPGVSFKVEKLPFGGNAIDATGTPLPPATFEKCKAADAILLGLFIYFDQAFELRRF